MPSDGQHTAHDFRRATFPEYSNSLRPTSQASPTCHGSLRHGPRVSLPEKRLCLEFFEDLEGLKYLKSLCSRKKSASYHAVSLTGHSA